MGPGKRVATNITFFDRLISGPVERRRGRLLAAILFVGSFAATSAILLEFYIGDVNVIDLIFLPSMSLLFVFLGIKLVRSSNNLRGVEKVAFTILAMYALSMLVYQIRVTLPKRHIFSEVMLWYPLLYLAAFLMHRRAIAVRTTVAIWIASALIGLFFTPYRTLMASKDASAFNSLMQFYVSGIVYILLLYAFSRMEESYAETRVLAYIDYLTQLPNRRYGESVLVQLLRQAREYGTTFSTIMIDLDGFKRINDRFGHDVGDKVLKRCALLIQRYLPRGARVIRWGGEEFLVILPDRDEKQALAIAEEIRRGLQSSPHEGVGEVLASFGVASLSEGDTLDELLMRADQAMYWAKKLGGNRVVAASSFSLATGEADGLEAGSRS